MAIRFIPHALIAGLSLAWPVQAFAQPTPFSTMPEYAVYRAELLQAGWLPTDETSVGTAGFSELICGRSICSARWQSGQRTISITVWPTWDEDTNQQIYRVSPQVHDVTD